WAAPRVCALSQRHRHRRGACDALPHSCSGYSRLCRLAKWVRPDDHRRPRRSDSHPLWSSLEGRGEPRTTGRARCRARLDRNHWARVRAASTLRDPRERATRRSWSLPGWRARCPPRVRASRVIAPRRARHGQARPAGSTKKRYDRLFHRDREVGVPSDVNAVAYLDVIEHVWIDDSSAVFPPVGSDKSDRGRLLVDIDDARRYLPHHLRLAADCPAVEVVSTVSTAGSPSGFMRTMTLLLYVALILSPTFSSLKRLTVSGTLTATSLPSFVLIFMARLL